MRKIRCVVIYDTACKITALDIKTDLIFEFCKVSERIGKLFRKKIEHLMPKFRIILLLLQI